MAIVKELEVSFNNVDSAQRRRKKERPCPGKKTNLAQPPQDLKIGHS